MSLIHNTGKITQRLGLRLGNDSENWLTTSLTRLSVTFQAEKTVLVVHGVLFLLKGKGKVDSAGFQVAQTIPRHLENRWRCGTI